MTAAPHRVRRALIIATESYDDPGLVDLRAPREDAHVLTSVLQDAEIGDFDVHTVIDAPSFEIAEEIEAFYADQPRDSLLLAYFSCHGVKDEDGRLYFAARNTKLARLAATGVPAQFVQEQMERCRSRQQVLLLDCCYSGAFGRLVPKAAQQVDVTERLSGRGRVVITASTAMQMAFESDALGLVGTGTSVFTGALAEGLATGAADVDRDGQVSMDDVYDYVHARVSSVTPNQTPSMQANVEGVIYLARAPAPTASVGADGRATDRSLAPSRQRARDQQRRRPDPQDRQGDRPVGIGWLTRRFTVGRGERVASVPLVAVLLIIVALVAGVVSYVNLRTPGWTWADLPALPAPLEAAAVAEYDGRLWVAGGVAADEQRSLLTAVNVYDPGSRTWRAGPPLPVALSHATMVSSGPQLFVIGGLSAGGSVATTYRLDSPVGTWVRDVPLPEARGAGAAVYDGHRIVFGGGVGPDHRASARVWTLEAGAWRDLGKLSVPREKLAAATDGNGTVWFFGGRDPNLDKGAFSEVDVAQSLVVKPAGSSAAVSGAAAVWWPGRGPCLLAGQTETGFSRSVSCQGAADPGAVPPDLTSARAGLGAAVIGDVVYVVGGYDGGHHGSSTLEAAPATAP